MSLLLYTSTFAFNAAYTIFICLCSFWFGSLFTLHWGEKLVVQMDLYVNVVACSLGIAGMVLVVTLCD